MSDDTENLLDSIFPVGKERWIKVRIKDRDICIKTFALNFHGSDKYEGYEITSIGLRDEYIPQISAIRDIEESILPILFGCDLPDYLTKQIQEIFTQKKEELKQLTIQTINAGTN